MKLKRQATAVHRFRGANERQEHQRVLQTLGLVDGDHLDQLLVAFQTQDLLFPGLTGECQVVAQMTDQRLLAIQFGGGLLQQFRQVQQVGEHSLTVIAGHQGLWQGKVVQQTTQHRQHALAAPYGAIATKLHDAPLPCQLVLIQAFQLGQRQVQRDTRQRGTQRAFGVRLGTGLEPGQQVVGFLSGEHRILVRQVHAAHSTRGQLLTHRLRFLAVADQNRNVGRTQPAQCVVGRDETGTALLTGIEQTHDLARATGCQLLTINHAGHRLVTLQVPDRQRCQGCTVDVQRLFAALGQRIGERHLIAVLITKQERTATLLTLLCSREDMVDRLDHRMTGAVVGVQRMPTAIGSLSGTQVGVDIGAAKRIDRLFRVANQEQPGLLIVGLETIDAVEDPVLDRIGVLEFVDQRHRKLLANQGGQTIAASAMQGSVEPEQHVIKAHLGAATLLFFKARADPLRRMLQHGSIRFRQTVERRLQLRHGLEGRVHRWIALPGFGNAVGGQASETGAQIQRFLCVVSGPGGKLFEPGFEITLLHFAAVDCLAGDRVLTQRIQLVGPHGPRCFQRGKRCPALLQ